MHNERSTNAQPMALKSLKATIALQSNSLDDAIVFLSQRFLRATATGCRIVQTPTEVCAADVCQPLIDGWMSGRVGYGKGKIVLVFRSGKLALAADMLIYTPKDGERFLYTKSRPEIPSTPIQAEDFTQARRPGRMGPEGMGPEGMGLDERVGNMVENGHGRPLATPNLMPPLMDAQILNNIPLLLEQIQALDSKLERLFVPSSKEAGGTSTATANPDFSSIQEFANILMRQVHQQTNEQLSRQVSQQIGAQLGDYLTTYLSTKVAQQVQQVVYQTMQQQLAQQMAIALEPALQQIDSLQAQMENLADYVAELDIADFDESPPAPQTDEEWLERIESTWGTVGDYEKYSPSYREANAETPLQEPPDWIVLCEFDWIWELCPTLATLYELIRGTGGIGDEGADILQQFGQHIDAKTGNAYYIYQLGGYSAPEALRQIAHNPDHSWLPELKRLWSLLADPTHPIFQMFGWEAEAIAALEQIVSPRQGYGQSAYGTGYQAGMSDNPTLRDYQAILNLGPFTPITLETIKRAYRQAMKSAHPDAGGSTEYAQQVNAAYKAVLNHYFPEAVN
ncbi:MAG: J domain-containing protein [Cyanobacteria bacterium P01_F01_bin.150]